MKDTDNACENRVGNPVQTLGVEGQNKREKKKVFTNTATEGEGCQK